MSCSPTVFHVKPCPAATGLGLAEAGGLGLMTVVNVVRVVKVAKVVKVVKVEKVVKVIPVALQQQAMLGEECMAKGRVLEGCRLRLGNLSPEGRGAFAVVESDVARGC